MSTDAPRQVDPMVPAAERQPTEADFMRIVHHVDALVQMFENDPTPEVREKVMELLQAVDALHRAGLVRLARFLAEQGHGALLDQASADPVIRSLFLLYDLIPPDPRLQVEMILEDARAYLQSHGGDVEILDVEEGIVRLRLLGACQECPASAVTLQQNIQTALQNGLPGFQKVELHPAERIQP